MLVLSLGLIVFLAPHLLRELGLRQQLRTRLGSEGAYKGLYSIVSLVGLLLIIYGKSIAPFNMIYTPEFSQRWISHLVMLPAIVLVTLGNLPTSYLAKTLRHPMLLGVLLWGVAHLWSNGDLASLLLFASFAIWALIKFVHLGLTAPVTKQPFLLWDIIGILLGLVLYALIFSFHGHLFGVGLSIA